MMWLLGKALYGPRVAPQRWGLKRDATMKARTIQVGDQTAELCQCQTAKGLRKLMINERVAGHVIAYVDDVLVTARN